MPDAARVNKHDSGWMGFSAGLPGSHVWTLTAYAPYGTEEYVQNATTNLSFYRYHQSFAVMGSTSGKWNHYSFLYRVQLPGYNWVRNPSHLRVMLQETGRQESQCGHALFDNVVITEAKVCSKGKSNTTIPFLIN